MGGPVFADYIVKIYEPFRRGKRYIAAFHFTSRGVDAPGGIRRSMSLLSGPLAKGAEPQEALGLEESYMENYHLVEGLADITWGAKSARSKSHKGQVAQDRNGSWDLGGGLIVKHHKLATVIEHLGSAGITEVSRDGLRTALRDVAHQRKSN